MAPDVPCPLGCGVVIKDGMSEAELFEHVKAKHPDLAKRMQVNGFTPNGSHGVPRGRTGRAGNRWYECDQCGGEFEYLRRGGTCRGCDKQING